MRSKSVVRPRRASPATATPAPPVSGSPTWPTRRLALLVFSLVILLGSAHIAWDTLRGSASMPPGTGYPSIVSAAQQYAEELKAGRYEQALFRVAWVQERLDQVRATSGNQDAESAELQRLAEEYAPTDRSRAVLELEGIEDSYLFAPRAEIVVAGADGGRSGLERPTAGRAWLALSYPDPSAAPRSDSGRPIRGLTVGLNFSEDGYLLKAEIIGNCEIDRFSIRYF